MAKILQAFIMVLLYALLLLQDESNAQFVSACLVCMDCPDDFRWDDLQCVCINDATQQTWP